MNGKKTHVFLGFMWCALVLIRFSCENNFRLPFWLVFNIFRLKSNGFCLSSSFSACVCMCEYRISGKWNAFRRMQLIRTNHNRMQINAFTRDILQLQQSTHRHQLFIRKTQKLKEHQYFIFFVCSFGIDASVRRPRWRHVVCLYIYKRKKL